MIMSSRHKRGWFVRCANNFASLEINVSWKNFVYVIVMVGYKPSSQLRLLMHITFFNRCSFLPPKNFPRIYYRAHKKYLWFRENSAVMKTDDTTESSSIYLPYLFYSRASTWNKMKKRKKGNPCPGDNMGWSVVERARELVIGLSFWDKFYPKTRFVVGG